MNIILVTKKTYFFLSTFFWRGWYCSGTCALLVRRQIPNISQEVKSKTKVKTSTESWSVRGMIWTVYKHWSAPSFEKMFLTVIDSEKSRTMSPSPGDIWAHLRTNWSEMCRNWCIWQFPLLRTVDIIKLVAGDQLCKKMSEMRRKQRWCTMLGGLMCTNDVVH